MGIGKRLKSSYESSSIISHSLALYINILDIFCGTGSLGIEAISRGSKNISFIDNSEKAINLTKTSDQFVKADSIKVVSEYATTKYYNGYNRFVVSDDVDGTLAINENFIPSVISFL